MNLAGGRFRQAVEILRDRDGAERGQRPVDGRDPLAIRVAQSPRIVVFGPQRLAASVLAGEMSATVAQAPKNMGALGVENVLKLKKGETIPPNIDTGTVLVTKENAEQYK